MQAVILAGGLGTRLGALTATQPKALVPVHGRPFIDYQLELLRSSGVHEAILCVGHLGEQIRDHCGDGRRYDLSLRYSDEGPQLLGTAGAVRTAEPLLAGQFILTYADAYLRLPYAALAKRFAARPELGAMVVYRNDNQYEPSNVATGGGLVTAYDKTRQAPGLRYLNFGVSLLRREAVALVPRATVYSQEQWYEDLIARRQLRAYVARQRPYEIGSPAGLHQFERLIARHRAEVSVS